MFAPASAAGIVRGSSIPLLFGNQLPRLLIGVQKTLAKSFETHPMRNVTKRAIGQRMEFCLEKAAELRKLGWGTERIVDSIGDALAAHLDHRPWEPSKRSCWAPGDGD